MFVSDIIVKQYSYYITPMVSYPISKKLLNSKSFIILKNH